jgi:hypothetical protein
MTRDRHSQLIRRATLLAFAGVTGYSIEYVHQVGDSYDIDASGAIWVGVAVGLLSVAAFASAGIQALAADRTMSTDTPSIPSAALPAPPPPK